MAYPLPRCDDCEQLLAALEGVLPFLTGNYWPGVEADAAVHRAIATARKVGAGRTATEGHNAEVRGRPLLGDPSSPQG